MSFYNCMLPYLYAKGDNDEDYEFYIRNLTKALNSWMKELGSKYSKAIFPMTGTITAPNGATSPYAATVGLRPSLRTISENDVKSALWNGDPKKSFPKLWKMIGDKIKFSFRTVNTELGKVSSFTKISPMLNTSNFESVGEQFMAAVQSGSGGMTPELFLAQQDSFLNLALTTIPPAIATVKSGIAPGGTFNGTVTIKLVGI